MVAALAPAVHAQPRTTIPDVLTNVKVTITDTRITLSRHRVPRGTNARFIISNIGTMTHNFTLGTAKPGQGLPTGFSRTLRPGTQQVILLFLNYRGVLPYFAGLPADRSKPGMKGEFRVA